MDQRDTGALEQTGEHNRVRSSFLHYSEEAAANAAGAVIWSEDDLCLCSYAGYGAGAICCWRAAAVHVVPAAVEDT